MLPPRPETCQTTRRGPPSRRRAAGPGLASVALSMRLQTRSGRRWRFRPALQGPICMPHPSGSLGAGSRADCMTSLLARQLLTQTVQIKDSVDDALESSHAAGTQKRRSCSPCCCPNIPRPPLLREIRGGSHIFPHLRSNLRKTAALVAWCPLGGLQSSTTEGKP